MISIIELDTATNTYARLLSATTSRANFCVNAHSGGQAQALSTALTQLTASRSAFCTEKKPAPWFKMYTLDQLCHD